MRKTALLIMISVLTMSNVLPSVVYATENLINDQVNDSKAIYNQTEEFIDEESRNENRKTSSSISEKVEEEQNQVNEHDILNKSLEENSNSPQRDVAIVDSGQNNTGFTWTLYEDGLLTLGGGVWLGGYPAWWVSHRTKIKTVKIVDVVDTSLTNESGFAYMFDGCKNLVSIEGLENLATQNSTNFTNMFYNCESLQYLDLSSFNTNNSVNFRMMFYGCRNLETLDIYRFDTSKALDFSGMFAFCSKLSELNVSNFNTENGVDFSEMFYGLSNIENLNLANFNTKNGTNFSKMFGGLSKIKDMNLMTFNTEKATDMSYMFQNMRSITTLNLSYFNTNNVTNMEYMFSGMTALKELDVTGFNVENVKKISACFSDLTSIEKLDIAHFKTTSIQNGSTDYVFRNLSNIKELNIENWELPENEAASGFFFNTLPEKITISQKFRFTSYMQLNELPSESAWVDKDDNVIPNSNSLLVFHNNNSQTNTYRIEKLYTLTFDTMGGSSVDSQQNIFGKTWTLPEIPEKNGYIFNYWSTDKEGKEPFNFSTTISDSITLYAQYSQAYIVNIPSTVNLNEQNVVVVSAENFQDNKRLIVSTSDTLTLINTHNNTHNNTQILKKNISKENYLEDGKILDINGVGKSENTLTIQEATGEEPAGVYKGVLDFIINFN